MPCTSDALAYLSRRLGLHHWLWSCKSPSVASAERGPGTLTTLSWLMSTRSPLCCNGGFCNRLHRARRRGSRAAVGSPNGQPFGDRQLSVGSTATPPMVLAAGPSTYCSLSLLLLLLLGIMEPRRSGNLSRRGGGGRAADAPARPDHRPVFRSSPRPCRRFSSPSLRAMISSTAASTGCSRSRRAPHRSSRPRIIVADAYVDEHVQFDNGLGRCRMRIVDRSSTRRSAHLFDQVNRDSMFTSFPDDRQGPRCVTCRRR